MARAPIVAIDGPSAAGKSSAARAAADRLGALYLPEAATLLFPRASLRFRGAKELERLELRLLGAEARRWRRALAASKRGRLVTLDTGPIGPLTYTWGLVAGGEAPQRVLDALVGAAERYRRDGSLGLPDLTIRLACGIQERRRRAQRAPGRYPVRLFDRHTRVARAENSFWRRADRVVLPRIDRRVRSLGTREEVAARVARAIASAQADRPTTAERRWRALLRILNTGPAAQQHGRPD